MSETSKTKEDVPSAPTNEIKNQPVATTSTTTPATTFDLIIKTVSHQQWNVPVIPSDTILNVKEKMEKMNIGFAECFKLIFSGKVLDNNQVLQELSMFFFSFDMSDQKDLIIIFVCVRRTGKNKHHRSTIFGHRCHENQRIACITSH